MDSFRISDFLPPKNRRELPFGNSLITVPPMQVRQLLLATGNNRSAQTGKAHENQRDGGGFGNASSSVDKALAPVRSKVLNMHCHAQIAIIESLDNTAKATAPGVGKDELQILAGVDAFLHNRGIRIPT